MFHPFLIIGLVVDLAFIYVESIKKMTLATILKGVASLFFVLLGIVHLKTNPSHLGNLIVYGLALGMIGDIFLNLRYQFKGGLSNKIFAVGIASFLLGHLMYIYVLYKMGARLLIAIVLAAIISIIAIPNIMKRIIAPSKGIKIFGVVYLLIVIIMCSFAVSCLFDYANLMPIDQYYASAQLTRTFTLGAVLFMVSDFIMILNNFGPKQRKILRATNLLTYYIGQLLIATCILFI